MHISLSLSLYMYVYIYIYIHIYIHTYIHTYYFTDQARAVARVREFGGEEERGDEMIERKGFVATACARA